MCVRPEDFRSQATVLEKSEVMPTLASKRGMRANTARHVLECTDVKTNAKLGRGMRKGRDGTSSLLVFRTPSQRRPCIHFEKVLITTLTKPYGSIDTDAEVKTFPKYSSNEGGEYLHRHHPGTLPYPSCCMYLLCLFYKRLNI